MLDDKSNPLYKRMVHEDDRPSSKWPSAVTKQLTPRVEAGVLAEMPTRRSATCSSAGTASRRRAAARTASTTCSAAPRAPPLRCCAASARALRRGRLPQCDRIAAWLVGDCKFTLEQALTELRAVRPICQPTAGFLRPLAGFHVGAAAADSAAAVGSVAESTLSKYIRL
jgi:hypothetical protein